MDFAYAIKQLKLGKVVCRKNSNDILGSSIKLFTKDKIYKLSTIEQQKKINLHKDINVKPYFVMVLSDENILITGWRPSMDDLLAEDWKVIK